MKLCPYPFSRMQTKNEHVHTENKGGFFPCCPSWFNEAYHEIKYEKNLDDIWNGRAATELRKRMYEGDYSLCNRNECKIPLMTIEELSNPEINFIETPISKENIEAIKLKNPVMPELPSSLHLVADLRCNLKCPTCRPEIISNNAESIEAEEEYDLVHRLKENVEIVKMSSSGEVFYSQTQRKLLKSFNKIDFPKLRRIHIVSNGTLFNQKAYNDLLPGTEFIKDISISLDAGSKEVYEKLRGPFWEQVVTNLEWIGQMRKAGRFEFFTLNFTLLKDNYRDVPNLVALGKRLSVDRILIQKYQFAPRQGYKTLEEQEAQAIHFPTHPEHIHMLRTLELFKNDPLVHTLLELEGFEQKIENNLQIRKMIAELDKTIEIIENRQFIKALVIFNDLFRGAPLNPNYLIQLQSKFDKKIIDLSNIQTLEFKNSTSSENNELVILLNTVLLSSIHTFQRSQKHFDVISTFIIFSHFIQKHTLDTLTIVANSLNELSCDAEAVSFIMDAISVAIKDLENSKEKEVGSNVYYLYMRLGYLLKDQSKFTQAIHYFVEAQKIEPSDQLGIASEQLYYLYIDQAFKLKNQNLNNDPLQSINYFAEAQKIEPADKAGTANEQLYYLYTDQAFKLKSQNSEPLESINYFTEAQKVEPADKAGTVNEQLYYLYKDQAFKLKNQNDEALQTIKYFIEAQKIEPADQKGVASEQLYYLYIDQAFKFKNQNFFDQALHSFRDAYRHEPPEKKGDAEKYISELFYYSRREEGFTFQRLGKFKIASRAFQEALLYEQGDADLFFSLGISLKRQKNYIEAKKSFNKVLTNNPEHYCALMELGSLHFLEDRPKEALRYFLKAQEFEPENRKKHGEKMFKLARRSRRLHRIKRSLFSLFS